VRCQEFCRATVPAPSQLAAITLKKVSLNILEAHPLNQVVAGVGHVSLAIQVDIFIHPRKSLRKGATTFLRNR
jgi:hypothetical protein